MISVTNSYHDYRSQIIYFVRCSKGTICNEKTQSYINSRDPETRARVSNFAEIVEIFLSKLKTLVAARKCPPPFIDRFSQRETMLALPDKPRDTSDQRQRYRQGKKYP